MSDVNITGPVREVKTSTDYQFVIDRSDDGRASIALQHLVTNADGSTQWADVSDASGAISQSNAGWDDAIPWAAGTYDLKYAGGFAGAADSWKIDDTDTGSRKVADRDKIRLHQGTTSTIPSEALEGCIGASAMFLARAHAALSAVGEGTTLTRIPMVVSDIGGSFFPLTVSESLDKSTLDQGEVATLTISLAGDGSADGVTKDIFFHVDTTDQGTGSVASRGSDYVITPVDGGLVIDLPSPGKHEDATWPAGDYLELPKGQQSATYTITSAYNNPGATNDNKIVDVTIDNYYVIRSYKGKLISYSDHASPKILIQNSSLGQQQITLKGPLHLPVQVSGDIQGLHRTYEVAAGDTINFNFQAYSIPDSLAISDGTTTYGTGGFVSNLHTGSFVAQSNRIQVDVVGSSDGTAWDLGLTETDATGSSTVPTTPTDSLAPTQSTAVLSTAALSTDELSTASQTAEPIAALPQLSGSQPTGHVAGTTSALSLLTSSDITIPSFGQSAAVTFNSVAGHQYLVRMVSPTGTPIQGAILNLFEAGAGNPFATSSSSNLQDEQAASFTVATSEQITATANADAVGSSQSARIEVFDTSTLTSPLLYFSPDSGNHQVVEDDQGINIELHRIGDLSQAATYTLLINPTGPSPLTGADIVGGSSSIPISFSAGSDVASANVQVTSTSAVAGTKSAIVTLDANSVPADVLANSQTLNLQTSLAIDATELASPVEVVTPILDSDDASATSLSGTMSFHVHLSSASSNPVYVSYATVDQTAIAGEDYQSQSGVLAFNPGQVDSSLFVSLIPNTSGGPDKTFSVNFLDPFGVSFSSNTSLLTDVGTIKEVTPSADTALLPFRLVDATLSYDILGHVIIDGPGGSPEVFSGIQHYVFTDGTVDENTGSPLVDDLFYDIHNHDVWDAHVDPETHYNQYGWHEGRDPNADFSTAGYLGANSDVAAAGVNPLAHYDQYGWKEGRDPAANFDTALYLKNNPDVAAAGLDPLLHYLQFGQAEGRQTYAEIGPAGAIGADGGFDPEYYLLSNPDVAKAALGSADPYAFALAHFNQFGWHEGRNPNAAFDTKGYLAAYGDVAAAGVNPLQHYDHYGWEEGRNPSAIFDTVQYEAHNPDVAAAHIDPMTHYLQYGALEGRATFAVGHGP